MERLILLLTFVAILVALIGGDTSMRAETITLDLPVDYADYALDPETGNILALNAEASRVELYRAIGGQPKQVSPVQVTSVGTTPCSVCYKQFGELKTFAVVCSQDPAMYLIDPSSGALSSRIALSQLGVTDVTCSTNPEDPFLYFNYGSGSNSTAGVVNLRSMQVHLDVIADSMECAISADGGVAYTRGSGWPSGFESRKLTSTFREESPVFTRWFRIHRPSNRFLPDAFGRFTAEGPAIFSRFLEKPVATLDVQPFCFSNTKPWIVGGPIVANGQNANNSPDLQRAPAFLAIVSYNTFRRVGDPVKLDWNVPQDEGRLPRGIDDQGDAKRLEKRFRAFVDEMREQVVLGYRQQLRIVPLSDFNLPNEPLMMASLKGPRQLLVGDEYTFDITVPDSRIVLSYETLPAGIEVDGNRLIWAPSRDQVGKETMVVALRCDKLTTLCEYEFTIEHSGITLPFRPSEFTITRDRSRLVAWEQNVPRSLRGAFRRSGEPGANDRIAVLEPSTGKVLAERQIARSIADGMVMGEHVILRLSQAPTRCEVLRMSDLTPIATIAARAEIQEMGDFGDHLLLLTTMGAELYSANTFQRTHLFPPHRSDPGQGVECFMSDDGLYAQGVLIDTKLKPALIVSPNEAIIRMPGEEEHWRPNRQRSMGIAREDRLRSTLNLAAGQQNDVDSEVFADGTRVDLEVLISHGQSPGSTQISQGQLEIALRATSGQVEKRQVLVRREFQPGETGEAHIPWMHTVGREAYVVINRELHRWIVPDELESDVTVPLKLVPKQCTLVIDTEAPTTLEHSTIGGRAPIRYSLLSPYDGMSVDTTRGSVTLDQEWIATNATRCVKNELMRRNGGEKHVETLRNYVASALEPAAWLVGGRNKGVPVAIPIRIAATDADLNTSSMQYFVFVELPPDEMVSLAKELDAERAQESASISNAPSDQAMPIDAAALERRIASLEERIEQLSRQMAEVLEKMEQR